MDDFPAYEGEITDQMLGYSSWYKPKDNSYNTMGKNRGYKSFDFL